MRQIGDLSAYSGSPTSHYRAVEKMKEASMAGRLSREASMAKKSRIAARRAVRNPRIALNKNYRVLVELSPDESPRDLGRFRLDHCCMPQPAAEPTGVRRLHAYASGATVAALRKAGRKVDVRADADAEGKRLQKRLIGKGDRFSGGRGGPRGVGKLV
jgi:hypothetical protein